MYINIYIYKYACKYKHVIHLTENMYKDVFRRTASYHIAQTSLYGDFIIVLYVIIIFKKIL